MSEKGKDMFFEDLKSQLQGILPSYPLEQKEQKEEKGGGGKKESEGEKERERKEEETLKRIRNFRRKPKEVRAYLDRFVIEQEEAKRALSVAICDHYNHVRDCLGHPKNSPSNYSKQNILLLGPTGVGKTYLMRTAAQLVGVPFVKADATKFSETGYVGADVEDLVRDLVRVAQGNIELARYGIIYVDEIDKIAKKGEGDKDVAGRGVQVNLLKVMEETDVKLFSPNDLMGQMQAMMGGRQDKESIINTRHILFIVSGSFDQLAESIYKRKGKGGMGFGGTAREKKNIYRYLKEAETKDFIEYGFEPEFIGRLPVRVACDSLGAEDLAEILKSSEGSLLHQYQRDFKGYHIKLNITNNAISKIAQKALEQETGARGLMTVLEKLLRDFKYELPSTKVRFLEIKAEDIDQPELVLKNLIKSSQQACLKEKETTYREQVKDFAERFQEERGLELVFEETAIERLLKLCEEKKEEPSQFFKKEFRHFAHGLAMVAHQSHQGSFLIDKACVDNPERYLSNLVVESFQGKNKDEPPATS